MTEEAAIEKLTLSLSRGAQLITPKGEIYEGHLKEVTDVLFAHLIVPQEVTVTSACFPEYDFERFRTAKVRAIARMENSWLLTLGHEDEFALGFGESVDNIMMYGFSSPDTIAEWCA